MSRITCTTTSGTATSPPRPTLLTVTHDGVRRDAVAQITKSTHVFLFDHETGAPLFPIEERPYPASDIPGERA